VNKTLFCNSSGRFLVPSKPAHFVLPTKKDVTKAPTQKAGTKQAKHASIIVMTAHWNELHRAHQIDSAATTMYL
jgi:hypothetical protein